MSTMVMSAVGAQASSRVGRCHASPTTAAKRTWWFHTRSFQQQTLSFEEIPYIWNPSLESYVSTVRRLCCQPGHCIQRHYGGEGGIVDSSSRNEGAGSKNAELGSLQGKIVKCFMCMLSCFSMTLWGRGYTDLCSGNQYIGRLPDRFKVVKTLFSR